MKKTFYLLLLITGLANAQIVSIPDPAFKLRLVSATAGNSTAYNAANNPMRIDTNFDGEIQASEAALVVKLDVNASGITDLTGITAFTGLTELYCTDNTLTTLNVASLTNLSTLVCNTNQLNSLTLPNSLTILSCFANALTSLSVNTITGLVQLNCNNNSLTSLNVSGLASLQTLQCQSNSPLTSLNASGCSSLNDIVTTGDALLNSINITGCTGLDYLYCASAQLTVLDASNHPTLVEIRCNDNLLTSLDITNCPNLTTINCSNNQLASLDLSGHPNLASFIGGNNLFTSLDLSGHAGLTNFVIDNNTLLTNLNVSGCAALIGLYLNGINHLQTLNVSGCSAIQTLECNSNELTSLDVSGMTNLSNLSCQNNSLTSLNLTGCTSLAYLYAWANNLDAIDLSGLQSLVHVDVAENNLTSLDVSGLTNLVELNCQANALTTLDLSANQNLDQLNCSVNSLETLFLKNGHVETDLSFGLNPDLVFICADEPQVASIQAQILTQGDSTVCNSYCSFTPGGNYNTIAGNILFDEDNNGCDSNDVVEDLIKVKITDSSSEYAVFTNSLGDYIYYTGAGLYTVTPDYENPSFFTVSPPNATVNFPDDNNNLATRDFCVAVNGVHPDLEIVIAPITPAKPGFAAVYQLVYKNKGNQTLTGNVTFDYNSEVLDYVGSTVIPSSQATGNLTWAYTNLLPFENRSIYVVVDVNAPTDPQPLNIGDILSFSAAITPVLGDETTADNAFDYNQTVVGSFDPNNITCVEGNAVSPTEIGNYLHYIINFENTGSADAENIVVRDIIDPAKFDVSSLQILNSSSPVMAKITGNVAEFIFKNINLHSGGHGNVLLKIKSKNTLIEGDSVSKAADIFFDYNAPISTNIENTVFQSLSNPAFETDTTLAIYPNPAKNNITIKGNFTIQSIQLYDVQGRLLQTKLANENEAILDISAHNSGVYFVKVMTDKGVKVGRIIKQ